MMTGLSEELLEIRRTARKFAKEYLAPVALEVEREEAEFPKEVLQEMGRAGLLGVDIPEEFGGPGLSALATAVVLEEISGAWFSAASYVSPIGAGPIIAAGSEQQKNHYLPGMVSGDVHVAFALTEPSGGSDAKNLQTRAKRVDGGFLLAGTKVFITNAHRADATLVYARVVDEGSELGGVTCFLVEANTPGFVVGQRFHTLGHAANPVWEIVLDDCFVPVSSVVGPVGKGFGYMRLGFARTRALYGSRAVGVAQAALDYASQYAQEREQFGSPLSAHQAIRFKLATMFADVETCRSMSYRAAAMADREDPDLPVAAAVAKIQAARMAARVTPEAIQIMGGHGLTKDHPLERYYREVRLFQIGDGTDEVLSMIISSFVNRRASSGSRVSLND